MIFILVPGTTFLSLERCVLKVTGQDTALQSPKRSLGVSWGCAPVGSRVHLRLHVVEFI